MRFILLYGRMDGTKELSENNLCSGRYIGISFMKKKVFTIFSLIILLMVMVVLGLAFGSVKIGMDDITRVICGQDKGSTVCVLIVNVRLPRVLGGLFAGFGLAVAGVILQGVMNNSLASPNTIGVNSGAGFGVMLALLFVPAGSAVLPVSAFAGAMITTLLIFALAGLSDSSRTTIVLAGITVSAFFNAGINTVKLLNMDITVNMTSFLIGSLSGLTLEKLFVPAAGITCALVLTLLLARPLNLLGLGDDIAHSLGLPVKKTRFAFLALSSILAGCVVSYAGLLSFIGLIVPHICRKLFGNDARFLLPCSALLGGSFVIFCDLMGRVLFAPFELPAGIPMAFIGGPFFLYLLLQKKGGRRINA